MPDNTPTQTELNPTACSQLACFSQISKAVNGYMSCVGNHVSKSIELPVVKIQTPLGLFMLRDNFYGINLYCEWDFPVTLPYSTFFEGKDQYWYGSEIDRKRGYSYRGWTDEEMDDPRILRVRVDDRYWSKVSGEEKDRWIARDTSTEWWGKDWSGGTLIREGDAFYVAPYAYAEGMKNQEQYQPYTIGDSRFIIWSGDSERTLSIMQAICKLEPTDA